MWVCGLRLPQDSPHHRCGYGEPSGRCEGPSSVTVTPDPPYTVLLWWRPLLSGLMISMSPGAPQDGLCVWCCPILSEKGRWENQQEAGLHLASALSLPCTHQEMWYVEPKGGRRAQWASLGVSAMRGQRDSTVVKALVPSLAHVVPQYGQLWPYPHPPKPHLYGVTVSGAPQEGAESGAVAVCGLP